MQYMREKLSSSQKTVTLIDYNNDAKKSQGKDDIGHINSVMEEPTPPTDGLAPMVTERQKSKQEHWSDSEGDYIDPKTISSIPSKKRKKQVGEVNRI